MYCLFKELNSLDQLFKTVETVRIASDLANKCLYEYIIY